jgi:intracellular sulfur oxidation DsrE/DsrF family protein
MSTRKDFMAAGSLFALTPELARAATPAPKPKSEPPELTFDFDQTRFNDILSKTAKHKQCFGIMKLNDGGPLEGMNNSINAYVGFLKEGSGAIQTVGVLYHGASIGFAMNDAIWNEYLIPGLSQAPPVIRQDVGTIKRGHGNPFKDDVRELVSKGASFFVCHNAIAGFSELVAGALKADPGKVHAAIMAGILPGALVVPAGVMAINACQEAKFTYIAT